MMASKSKFFLGIDPGYSGAAAVITGTGKLVGIWDCPSDIPAMRQVILLDLSVKPPVFAAMENVHAMPKQGVTSTFKFGMNFGAWQAYLAMLTVPYELVAPRKWQQAVLDSGNGNTKTRVLEWARRRWPNAPLTLKKHHNRADALGLAEYARLRWKEGACSD